jgi:hypothetical protein
VLAAPLLTRCPDIPTHRLPLGQYYRDAFPCNQLPDPHRSRRDPNAANYADMRLTALPYSEYF